MLGLMLAAAIYSVDPPSMATWSEIAQEVKATGRVTCNLTAEELRLRAKPLNRPSPRWGTRDNVAPHPGCVVLQIQINSAGRVTHASVLRQKGQLGAILRKSFANELRFSQGRNDRVAYMSFVVSVSPDWMADVLKDLERRIAEDAKAATPSN